MKMLATLNGSCYSLYGLPFRSFNEGGWSSNPMDNNSLPVVLQTVAPFLDNYGYLAVGIFCVLQRAGIPFMLSWTTLMAASVYAGAGKLNIFVIIIVAIIAENIGSNIGFAIGRYGGEPLILKYGRYVFINAKKLRTAYEFLNRYGGPILVISPFISALIREFSGIVAGTAEMKWSKFFIFNGIGAVLWVSVWATVGYEAGSHIDQIYKILIRLNIVFLILLALTITGFLAKKLFRKGSNM